MPMIETVIFYLVLIDALSANILAWIGEGWYLHHFRHISRYFPVAKGWTAYYLVLVLWIGWLLMRNGTI